MNSSIMNPMARTALLLVMATGLEVQGGTDDYTLSRYSIDGGGVMRSTGGAFELSSTIGQSGAGVSSGGDYEMTGGFWLALAPTDCDESGVVDLIDYLGLEGCFAGPGEAIPAECACYDTNGNGSVDLMDIADAQNAFNGQ